MRAPGVCGPSRTSPGPVLGFRPSPRRSPSRCVRTIVKHVTEPFAELNAALPPHYIIDRELGRGGMALVYLARDTRHERFVALKTLRPEIAVALGRERFLREIKLAARLQHPNILPVYDSGDAGGTLYYVMPFVEGESLRDRLDHEPQLPVDDALQIVRDAIPDELELVIERALEKVPADRYQTSGEFAKALTAASTGTVSRVTAARRHTRRQLVWRRPVTAGIGLGALALIAGAWLLFGRHRDGGASAGGSLAPNRVAVLYFNDASRDSSLRYLADGVTESLIDQLSAIRALDVISRNGVAPFRGRDIPRDSIARALDAGTLVEGEVEPVGTRARVTIRLVDGASGADVGRRQSFELPVDAPLAIRDSLVNQAAILLRERLGDEVQLREQHASTKNVAAWSLVQRAERLRKDADARPNEAL